MNTTNTATSSVVSGNQNAWAWKPNDERTGVSSSEFYTSQQSSLTSGRRHPNVEAKLALHELQVPQLVDEERLVRGMEEGERLHPLQPVRDAVIVHQQACEEEAAC